MSGNTDEREPTNLLIVDDEPSVRLACERYLTRCGHRVHAVSSVEEAHGRLAAMEYDVVITDLQMPGSSGLDLLEHLHTRCPRTRAILISGRAEAADAAFAIERGVDALLLKPFDLDELRASVEKALAELRGRRAAVKDRELYEAMVRQREMTSRTWVLRAAHALAAAVEAKDAYTAGHAARVTAYGMNLLDAFAGIDVAGFRLGGQLHDVGKIGIPDAVLNKPACLTEEEMGLVWDHPATGARILEPLIDDPSVIAMVRWHHERWDGGGYPDRLAGASIPLPARILAVADTLDAMTSARSYRTGLPWQVAVDEIRRCAGTQFDPEVVQAFEERQDVLQGLHRSFASS